MTNNDVRDLEHKADIELARLRVAESIGWLAACLAAVLIASEFNLLIGAFVGFIGYFLVTWPYRVKEEKADCAYRQAANLIETN
jgi:hypothetical protein